MTVTIVRGVTADDAVNASSITGTLPVVNGGTGATSATAYAVITGGTTSTSPYQSVSGVGTSGQVLTSNGTGTLPTWQAGGGGAAAAGTLTGTTLASNVVNSSLQTVGTISTGVWNGTAIDVAHGGTGDTSLTAYAILAGGTTSTGAVQSISGVGTSGQLLVSNGASALPTWQSVSATTALNLFNTVAVTVTDTTGRMTLPAQPRFFALNDLSEASNNITGDGTLATVVFQTVVTNVGSYYDNTTGIFTAPVTGFYTFNSMIIASSMAAAAARNVQLYFSVNNAVSNLRYGYYGTTSPANSNDILGLSFSDNLQLTANDTVRVKFAVVGGSKDVSLLGAAVRFSGALLG